MNWTTVVELLAGYAGPILVGAVLLLTGVMKLIEPGIFAQHVMRLGVVPMRRLRWFLPIAILAEMILGGALLAGWVPRIAMVAAAVMLAVFTIVTLRAARAGRITSCGCYQGLIDLTPQQSAWVNVGYLTLLGLAFFFRSGVGPWWAGIAVGAVALLGLGYYRLSGHRARNGKPALIEFGAIRSRRPWKSKWLPDAPVDLQRGEHLVVFISTTCTVCKPWLPVLNAIHTVPSGLPVLGVLTGEAREVVEFMASQKLRFPLIVVPGARFGRLIRTTPTGAHVVDGRIEEKFVGSIPPCYVECVRTARRQGPALPAPGQTAAM
ncbi:MAG: MauE/DoxX family redox-associated membrane protein [Planctomycetota bacterium]